MSPILRAARLAAISLALPAGAALAQRPATPQAAPVEEDEIVVTAGARRGAALGDIKPEVTLSPADIRSYGVSSVADLLTELAPQLRSGRGDGPPIVLLNGQRIGSFQEIRDLPSEAIARAEVLPEEVALRYGYPADQRVVNIVLRQRFRATTAELTGGGATSGGAATAEGELGYLRIRDGGRLNVDVEARGGDGLTEAARGIVNPAAIPGAIPGAIDPTAFRSLTADTRGYSGNLVYNRALGSVSATANARFELTTSDRLTGLPPGVAALPVGSAFDPLGQRGTVSTGRLGLTLNGNLARWRWSLTPGYDRVDTRTVTDIGAATPGLPARDPNLARGLSNIGSVDALLSGPVLALPAGDVTVSARVGGSVSRFESESLRFGAAAGGRIGRDIVSGQASVDVPVASTRNDSLAFLGTLNFNGNAAVRHLSDVGTLRTLGGGLNWRPTPALTLIASLTDDRVAPTVQQLGNPTVTTPGVTLFDPVTGATVIATQLSGGNAGLNPSRRRVTKLSANWRPIADTDLSLSAEYVNTRVRDAVAAFPGTGAAIQAAFPDRFGRDAAGALTQVDARPVNFARTDDEELRWGVNLSMPLASKQPRPPQGWTPPWVRQQIAARQAAGQPAEPSATGQFAASQAGPERPPGGGRGGGRGFGGGGFGGGQNGGRLQFALYHTWHLTNAVAVRPGLQPIDLLNGGSITGAGGQPRHELEAQAGYTRDGLGARLSANWRGATRVDGLAGAPDSALRFGAIGTLNLRLFFNPTARWRLIDRHPWLRGSRISLNIVNLFDDRQQVTNAAGAVPFAYQPGTLDPVGRRVTLSVRKLFF